MENKKDKINCSSKLLSGNVKIFSVNTLMLQKKNLFVNAAGIACQVSVCADDTVAGDYNRNLSVCGLRVKNIFFRLIKIILFVLMMTLRFAKLRNGSTDI